MERPTDDAGGSALAALADIAAYVDTRKSGRIAGAQRVEIDGGTRANEAECLTRTHP
jgi:hypothetical protein